MRALQGTKIDFRRDYTQHGYQMAKLSLQAIGKIGTLSKDSEHLSTLSLPGRLTVQDLGDRLRKYRVRAGLSIYDVEKRVGRHFSTISKYERGERRPNLDTLRELAGVYEVHPARLVTQVDDVQDMFPEEVVIAARLLQRRPDILEILSDLEGLNAEQIRLLSAFLHTLDLS